MFKTLAAVEGLKSTLLKSKDSKKLRNDVLENLRRNDCTEAAVDSKAVATMKGGRMLSKAEIAAAEKKRLKKEEARKRHFASVAAAAEAAGTGVENAAPDDADAEGGKCADPGSAAADDAGVDVRQATLEALFKPSTAASISMSKHSGSGPAGAGGGSGVNRMVLYTCAMKDDANALGYCAGVDGSSGEVSAGAGADADAGSDATSNHCMFFDDDDLHAVSNVSGASKGGGGASGACVYPTLFALWWAAGWQSKHHPSRQRCSGLLPEVVVHAEVSHYLMRGADLMLPGVVYADACIRPGTKISVRAVNNPLPFAVGVASFSAVEAATRCAAVMAVLRQQQQKEEEGAANADTTSLDVHPHDPRLLRLRNLRLQPGSTSTVTARSGPSTTPTTSMRGKAATIKHIFGDALWATYAATANPPTTPGAMACAGTENCYRPNDGFRFDDVVRGMSGCCMDLTEGSDDEEDEDDDQDKQEGEGEGEGEGETEGSGDAEVGSLAEQVGDGLQLEAETGAGEVEVDAGGGGSGSGSEAGSDGESDDNDNDSDEGSGCDDGSESDDDEEEEDEEAAAAAEAAALAKRTKHMSKKHLAKLEKQQQQQQQAAAQGGGKKGKKGKGGGSGDDAAADAGGGTLTREGMDDAIVEALLLVLKYVIRDRELPMLASAAWAMVVKVNAQLNIKKSSFRKVSALLAALPRLYGDVIKSSVGTGAGASSGGAAEGVLSITSINRNSDAFRRVKHPSPDEFRAEIMGAGGAGGAAAAAATSALTSIVAKEVQVLASSKRISSSAGRVDAAASSSATAAARSNKYTVMEVYKLPKQLKDLVYSAGSGAGGGPVASGVSSGLGVFGNAGSTSSAGYAANFPSLGGSAAPPPPPVAAAATATPPAAPAEEPAGPALPPWVGEFGEYLTAGEVKVWVLKVLEGVLQMNASAGAGAGAGGDTSTVRLSADKKNYLLDRGSCTSKNSLCRYLCSQADISADAGAGAGAGGKKGAQQASSDAVSVRRGEVASNFIAHLTTYHVVINPLGAALNHGRPASGKPPTIVISTEKRTGNKHVTRVSGLQQYGMDTEALGQQWKKKWAASVTEAPDPRKPKTAPNDVLIQGSLAKEIESFLVNDCTLPKTVVQVQGGAKKK